MKIIYMDKITRKYVKEHPEYVFLFGDNLMGQGYGGQAREMRDEPNAHGIPTKIKPTMEEDAFFNDDMFDEISKFYDDIFLMNQAGFNCGDYEAIVIPSAGLGTGLAELSKRAPKIYKYLLQKIKELSEEEENVDIN
jgi:hypothetical protein